MGGSSTTYQAFTFITVNRTYAGMVVGWPERSCLIFTSRSWVCGIVLDKNTIRVLIFIKLGIVGCEIFRAGAFTSGQREAFGESTLNCALLLQLTATEDCLYE